MTSLPPVSGTSLPIGSVIGMTSCAILKSSPGMKRSADVNGPGSITVYSRFGVNSRFSGSVRPLRLVSMTPSSPRIAVDAGAAVDAVVAGAAVDVVVLALAEEHVVAVHAVDRVVAVLAVDQVGGADRAGGVRVALRVVEEAVGARDDPLGRGVGVVVEGEEAVRARRAGR